MFCNGYCISGNLAEKTGRKYEVSGGDGRIIFETTESITRAIEHAESLPSLYEASDKNGVVFTTPVLEEKAVEEEKATVPESPAEDAVEESQEVKETKPTRSRKKK